MLEESYPWMTARLGLGTVQFGLPYGIANAIGRVAPQEVEAILLRAAQAGMDTLDTAIAYGDSESCLGNFDVSGWQVVTKLPALPELVTDVQGWVTQQVSSSLQRLRVPRLNALLLHRPLDLLGDRGPAYRDALQSIKTQGLAYAVGVSIYAPSELDRLWPVFRPDLLQAPLNVLDRRLIHSGWLQRLNEAGVRVHVRSIFLQGLLLMPAENRPAYFWPWRELLDNWFAWCAKNKCTAIQAALNFALAQEGIERVIVGVDSVNQLVQILEAGFRPGPLLPSELCSENLNLIDPSRWELK